MVGTTGLRFCTVDFRRVGLNFLPDPTYIFLEEPDILQTIEGLLWQTTWRDIKGLLWQADLRQSSSKPPKKNFAPWLCPPSVVGFFLSRMYGEYTMQKNVSEMYRKNPQRITPLLKSLNPQILK
jgi:hypothetical protein